ncbi:hypothetical protein [Jeotgalibaca ciconiae]|uniref:M50 family peptidase n=1 Tax=Jeotgalibaca ciconiae TaxID=2496265 RepID=A0A3S9HCQ6_9LACT|nr:hypothetical protein [Jeotgalibaca ciconiae]AZP05139.1 hypothetical protein EJN90_11100 [Jeotgalibaca ciconiae]HJB23542.1 hypothetical protein [Candidatus Jeotgalibaca pullicola]
MKASQRIFIFLALVGLSIGYFLGNNLVLADLFIMIPFYEFFVVIILAAYSVFFHVILHEIGHFIFGKLTGYHLIYFHIPYFHYDANTKSISGGKNSPAGMLGQCLMNISNKKDDTEKPYFLYLAGGLIVNFLTGALLYAGSFYFVGKLGFYSFLFSLPALLLFLGNALPYGATDGRMIQEIRKSTLNKTLYFKQIEMGALLQAGKVYSEIPTNYFTEVKDGKAKQSFLGEYPMMVYYQALMEQLNFVEADRILSEYIESTDFMKSPYVRMIAAEKLFCDAIFGRREEAKKMMEKIENHSGLKDYYSHSIITQIAYTLFMEINIEKSRELFPKIEKINKTNFNKAELQLRETLAGWLQGYLNKVS